MTVTIAGRPIGAGHEPYIVAELSGNHLGALDRALASIRAAAEAGADAIKLQTYTADTITLRSDNPQFVVRGEGPWAGRTLAELYDEAHTPWEWHARLFQEARSCGIHIFSTPFDFTAVDFLEKLDVPAFKIASFELVDDALLRKVGGTRKPVILSTGMATVEEIFHALQVLEQVGCEDLVLLKCTSSYPAPDSEMHLRTIPKLAEITGRPVGLSDHSLGTTAAVAAVALGACLIEKHFTLSRAAGGVDSHFSLEPEEFRKMADDARHAFRMLGASRFGAGVAEEGNVQFRRSLYIVEDVQAGDRLTSRNLRSIRPGDGLSPRFLDLVLGKRVTQDVRRGTPLRWTHITSE